MNHQIPQVQSWGGHNLSMPVEEAVCPKSIMEEGCTSSSNKQEAQRRHFEPLEKGLTVCQLFEAEMKKYKMNLASMILQMPGTSRVKYSAKGSRHR